MNQPLTIAVLLGTVREKRESIHAARYVAEFAKRYDDVAVEFVDPKELTFHDEGEDGKDATYTDIVTRSDAFIIVTPEYNHSVPSSLKRMLDSEFGLYKHKPVALAGVSSGPWGGVRVCEALLPICHRLGLVNIQPELYFPNIQNMFDDTGTIKPELKEMYEKNTQTLYDELIWFARLLKGSANV